MTPESPLPDPEFSRPHPKGRLRISWVWAAWWTLLAIIVVVSYFVKPPDKPEGETPAQPAPQAAGR